MEHDAHVTAYNIWRHGGIGAMILEAREANTCYANSRRQWMKDHPKAIVRTEHKEMSIEELRKTPGRKD